MNRSFSAVLIGLGQRATRGCLRSPSLAVLLAGMAFPSAQAMDLDPQLVGQWPGNFQAVEVSGQYAYVAAWWTEEWTDEPPWRGGLQIVDIGDPFNPRLISGCDTRLLPYDVTISGHFAYVMTWLGEGDVRSELEIIDISDPTNPQPVGLLQLPVTFGRLAVSGNYVYLAAGKTGLQVIDVSDARNPQPIASLPTGGNAWDVAVVGGYAYIADHETGLHVADVRDPANPQAVGRHVLNGGSASGVCVAGSHAYVIENTQPVGNTYAGKYAMNVLDISDPSNPQMISSYSTRYQWNRALTVSGSFAYVSTSYHDSGWSEIEIIDLNNPVHPVRAGGIFDYGNVVVVSDRYAYVASTHLKIFEINRANPARVGQYSFGDGRWARRVAVSDGYAYVANMEQDDKERDAEARLRILDIRDATNPVPVGFYATGVRNDEFSDIVAFEGYAYLATTHQSDPPSIIVLDIRDPGNPQRVGAYSSGSFSPGSFEWGGSLAVSKGFLYLGLSATFRVLNVSDPANLTEIGILDLNNADSYCSVRSIGYTFGTKKGPH